jgi:Na+-translocating ferredoxin:NAD+ oxidoreductase RnfD subunit
MARESTTAHDHTPGHALGAPFIRAPEGARIVFLVTLGAICGPMTAGIVLFGWRAAFLAAISIFSCVAIERL